MEGLNKLWISLLFTVFLTGSCGVAKRSTRLAGRTETKTAETSKPPAAMTVSSVSSLDEVRASLMQAYRDWKGTPYVLGGSSTRGVDCSQLVHIIFDDYFDITLPSTTRTQLSAGTHIRRSSIQTGDLIFFKTGRKLLHVGIAVNQGEFLHASTSSGVRISKLGNRYWRKRFFTARRVL